MLPSILRKFVRSNTAPPDGLSRLLEENKRLRSENSQLKIRLANAIAAMEASEAPFYRGMRILKGE